jgi:hypothetical protein
VEKKALFAAAFISVLLLIAMTEGCFVKLAQANPYMYYESVSPPAGSTPLVISVSSPNNDAVYRMNDVAVAFNVSAKGTSLSSIYGIYFEASWMQGNVTVYKQNSFSPEFPAFWSYNETFGDMPDGEYSVVITAWGGGSYAEGVTAYLFEMPSVSVVNFTIATPPEVSVLSPLNRTYELSTIQLNFTMSDKASLIKYSLDGQDNSTLYGNMTLTGLPNGEHNLTVYAWDDAGNVGSSETVTFTIAETEPFPTVLVIAASGTTMTAVIIGVLFYFKKRRREAEQA